MAPPQILSRTQRRHEQKQTILVLALVAVVALLSFLAGIMVGRGLTPPPPVAAAPVLPPRLPVPPPPAATAAVVAAATAAGSPAPPPAGTRPDQLTFYDSLAKGEQPPLGSGINLPPPSVTPQSEPVADVVEELMPEAASTQTSKTLATTGKTTAPPAKTAAPASKATTATTKTVAAAKSPAKPVTLATVTAATGKVEAAATGKKTAKAPAVGTYVIQAASFHKAQEAAELSRRLSRKGYTPFVEAIDLGSKGLWHRVYVGPFSNVAAADKTAKRLKGEERLAPVVRKR